MGCLQSKRLQETDRFHDIYQLGQKLGEGSFGQVREARDRISGRLQAVKILDARIRDRHGPVAEDADQALARSAAREIYLWEQIGHHPNCVCLIESFRERGLFYMVMERHSCSLMDRLTEGTAMHEASLRGSFHDMLQGLAHLHSLKIAHRDVKPDNFLVGVDMTTVKLCDFGMAAHVPWGYLCGVYGTSPYMAPEMLRGAKYDESVDVWSLGATCFLMLFGEFPYMPDVMTPQAMKRAIRYDIPKLDISRQRAAQQKALVTELPDAAIDFVQRLLERQPSTRVKVAAALRHCFLAPPSSSPSDSTRSCESRISEVIAQETFQKARSLARKVKKATDPTVQRNIDELLSRLQKKFGVRPEPSRSSGAMSFSDAELDTMRKEYKEGELRIRKESNTLLSATHSGTTS